MKNADGVCFCITNFLFLFIFLGSLPEDVPQILINREPLKHLNFDVELLGDCDTIVEELCKNLNWDNKSRSPVLHEISKCELKTPTPSELGEGEIPVLLTLYKSQYFTGIYIIIILIVYVENYL